MPAWTEISIGYMKMKCILKSINNFYNTLSENGGVTRGICSVNEQGHLTKVTETKNIVKTAEGAAVQAEDGSLTAVQAHCPVSMNMWGFTPEIFGILEKGFAEFLGALKDQTKGEYLIPTVVDQLIQTGVCNVTVLESRDKWFGVTYKEDKIKKPILFMGYIFRTLLVLFYVYGIISH